MTEQIGNLRAEIEALDEQLVQLIGRRLELVCAIGRAKVAAHQPIIDPAREALVVARAAAAAREYGVPEDDMRALYWRILAMSRRTQNTLREADCAQFCSFDTL